MKFLKFLAVMILLVGSVAVGISQDTFRDDDNNRNKWFYLADSFLVADSYDATFDIDWEGGATIDCHLAGVTYEGGSETVSLTTYYKLVANGAWIPTGDTISVDAVGASATLQSLVNASDVKITTYAASASDTLLAQAQCLIKEVALTDEQP